MAQSDSISNPPSGANTNGKKQYVKDGGRKKYHRKHKNKKEIYKNDQIIDSNTSFKHSKEHSTENPLQDSQNGKKSQGKSDGGKIQRTAKKRNKDHFRLSVDKSKRESSIRRENEISQCIHVLSNKNFKLLKRGQRVTSYGFIRNQKLLGIPNCKFIIDIPLDYPHSPIKLNHGSSEAQYDNSSEEKLDILTENFNFKSVQLLVKSEPIISQINYLIEKAEILSRRDYGSVDKHEQAFFTQFA